MKPHPTIDSGTDVAFLIIFRDLLARMWHDFCNCLEFIGDGRGLLMVKSLPFDEGEKFNCDKCKRAIKDWNDMVTISVVDEETGDESVEETLCIDCHKSA